MKKKKKSNPIKVFEKIANSVNKRKFRFDVHTIEEEYEEKWRKTIKNIRKK